MQLPDHARRESGLLEQTRDRRRLGMGVEICRQMRVPELPVRVVVLSRQDHRPARTARRCGTKSVFETRSPSRQPVHIGRPDHRVAVTPGQGTVVIGDQQQDVAKRFPARAPCLLGPGRGGTAPEDELTAIE